MGKEISVGWWLSLVGDGMGLDRLQQSSLLVYTEVFVRMYANHQSIDKLATSIVDFAKSPAEVQFMCKAFGRILKKGYKAPYRAIAVQCCALEHACSAKSITKAS